MGAPCGIAPGLHKVFCLGAFERPWHRPLVAMRDRARCYRRPLVPILDLVGSRQRPVAFPWTPGARLAAGMTELDSSDRILLFYEFHETRQRLAKRLPPDTQNAHAA